MADSDPKKAMGKMSAYAFFVQTCREEHKKKNPEVPVNFAEFFKKCFEIWRTMSGKEKSKFHETTKEDKVCEDLETKDWLREVKRRTSVPPKGHCLDSSYSVQDSAPRSTNPGISIGDVAKKLGKMWNNLSEKQPYNNKGAKLKEKYEKNVADCKSKGKFDGTKSPAKVAPKKMEEKRRRRNKKTLFICLLVNTLE